MKLILSSFAFFIIASSSNAQLRKTTSSNAQVNKFESAVAYNDFIVNEQTKVGMAIKKFNTTFENSTDTVEIHAARIAISRQADSAVNRMNKMVPYKGDTSLKKNAISLFGFYSKIAGKEYKQFIWIFFSKEKTTEQKSKELQDIVNDITEREKIYDSNFLEAQKAFATKYNIKLTENEFKMDQ
ncbi:MAG: hypothetical protein IPP96_15475 [Chitinophagaceae bacterium]|nr:hypothetical protein [Chitinophagaceae bacterium]